MSFDSEVAAASGDVTVGSSGQATEAGSAFPTRRPRGGMGDPRGGLFEAAESSPP
jgi:hypothetical protein